jgi:hypothetical protein
MPEQVATLTRTMEEAAAASKRCAGDACDAKDAARQLIARDSAAEGGYRDLLGHFAEKREYAQADSEFTRLAARYPESIWPHKVLAEIYHDNLSVADSRFLERSYREMDVLRRMKAFKALPARGADLARIETDFAEVALSARKYAEVDEVARSVLAARPTDGQRYNMALFMYIGSVVQHQADSADVRLTRLESIVKTLPADFYNNWIYSGTNQFLGDPTLTLSPVVRNALTALCREGAYPQKDGMAAIAANRIALAALRSGSERKH